MSHSINREKLRSLRRDRGLTQQGLAEPAGISVRTLQRAEGGWALPKTLLRVAEVLQVSPDDLRGRERPVPPPRPPQDGGHVVMIASTKRGTGRTTLAISLAGLLQTAGHRVCLLDFDISGEISFYLSWAQSRRQPVPSHVHAKNPREAGGSLAGLRQEFDYVVIDASATEEAELMPLALMADQVILTTVHPKIDFRNTHLINMWLSANLSLHDKVSIVYTRASRYKSERRDQLEFLRTIGLPLCKTVLQARTVYDYASFRGRTVTTDDPEGLAAAELGQLCYELGWISERPSGAVRDRRRTKKEMSEYRAFLRRGLSALTNGGE